MQNKQRVTVGLIQMACVLKEKQANLDKAASFVAQLAGQADVVCLPELFNIGYDLDLIGDDVYDLAEPVPDGRTTRWLAKLARRSDLAIVAGLVEQAPHVTGLLYDTVVLINRRGEFAGRYRKSHLYPAEHRFFRPGDELPVFDLDGLRVGVAICFEAAFPTIFSTLALQGAQIVFNPSAVPVGFDYLQDLRTRARAQDNQFFVAAVNHVGNEGSVIYCGRSQMANPRGETVVRASGESAEALVVELDLSLIRDQRIQEPVFRGFRPELYRFSPLERDGSETG
ncbi:MAG: carbon-nitrogen hydrolase family protein [Anaerolineae bacterium]